MLYFGGMFIAKNTQTLKQCLTRETFSKAQGKCRTRELCRTEALLHRCPDVRKNNDRLTAQETGKNIHALCRPLQAFRGARRCKVNVIQLRQLVDIYFGKKRG